ncbi:Na+/H+ antiporter NhaA [Pseudomonas aeruginosa]|nr:Na+/H+ antiporter NhaA [Pseudomonas aeruginosa]
MIVLWFATVYSGIHASLAGMAAGLLIPAYATQRHKVVAARQLFRDFWQSPSAASAHAVDRGLSRGISVNERLHGVPAAAGGTADRAGVRLGERRGGSAWRVAR